MTQQEQRQRRLLRRTQDECGAFIRERFLSGARLALLTLVALAPAYAQETPRGSAQDECVSPKDSDAPVVTEAYRPQAIPRPGNQAASGPIEYSHKQDAQLRDTIALKVLHLESLLQWQNCTARLGVKKRIVLYLNDRALPDVVAEPPLDPVAGVVMFPLKRTDGTREVWTHLLGKPTWTPRTVRVSLGLEDQFGIQSTAELQLKVLPVPGFVSWLAIFIALLGGFLALAWQSNVLRDGNAPLIAGATKPWSLARVQAAWWFFLVLASYLLIGFVTGDYTTSITGSSLVLLGISVGTAISSVAVDMSKDTPANAAQERAARERLTAELNTLHAQIAQFDVASADPATAAEHQIRTEVRNTRQSQLRRLNHQSESFVTDILSDANGINLHRFQMAAWTLVLGVVFVMQVFRELSMPMFDETLLGLMGLSSATYIALKTTEPIAPKPDNANQPKLI